MLAIVRHLLLALTNTLAFYVVELITTVISFMLQAPGVHFISNTRPNVRPWQKGSKESFNVATIAYIPRNTLQP